MRHIFCFALCMTLRSFGTAALQFKGLVINSTHPEVIGGASHECHRDCVVGDTRICYYEFAVVEWVTMSKHCGDCPYKADDCYNRGCITAGGDKRRVDVINYMLPGPSIQVCKGDIVRIKLTNTLGSEGVTIHWHGMGQNDTPYMDGVPFVTQCPINAGNSFVYNFTADPAGTHMWHSHMGFQEADGLHGSLIVRDPMDVNAHLYDFDLAEHKMMIWHWYNVSTATLVKSSVLRGGGPPAYSLIVNGYASTVRYTKENRDYYTPRASFTVTKGCRYRFRMMDNSAVYCPVQVSVDKHKLIIIASDGATIKPIKADSFIINAGERYDFVLIADQEERNYWIRFRGLGICGKKNISSVAILRYERADDADPSEAIGYDDANRFGVLVNPVGESRTDYSNNTLIRVSDFENTDDDGQHISGTPDTTIYIALGLNKYTSFQIPGPYAQFNNISFKFPPIPLLTQYEDVKEDMYCTPHNLQGLRCTDGFCACPFVYQIKKNSLLEIIIVSESSSFMVEDHPIHLHGHYFQVVASYFTTEMNITTSKVRAWNEAGKIERKLDTAPLKDVIGVPASGYVVLRVVTDNPGYWLLHCHVSMHFEDGMGAILKIGNHSEMVRTPTGFPTCGANYDITEESKIISPNPSEISN